MPAESRDSSLSHVPAERLLDQETAQITTKAAGPAITELQLSSNGRLEVAARTDEHDLIAAQDKDASPSGDDDENENCDAQVGFSTSLHAAGSMKHHANTVRDETSDISASEADFAAVLTKTSGPAKRHNLAVRIVVSIGLFGIAIAIVPLTRKGWQDGRQPPAVSVSVDNIAETGSPGGTQSGGLVPLPADLVSVVSSDSDEAHRTQSFPARVKPPVFSMAREAIGQAKAVKQSPMLSPFVIGSSSQAEGAARKDTLPVMSPVELMGQTGDGLISAHNGGALGGGGATVAVQPAGSPAEPPLPPPPLITKSQPRATIPIAVAEPSVVKRVTPVYPQMAREFRIAGTVSIEVTTDDRGYVKSAKALSGPSPLREAAVAAAKQWKFTPVTSDVPMKHTTRITFRFQL